MVMSDDEDFLPDMDKLRELDPEFYAFLEENDKQLLDFKATEETAVEADGDEVMTEVTILTGDKLKAMMNKAQSNKCFRSLRGLLAAYRVAARMSTSESTKMAFRIDDIAVFNSLLEWVLTSVPGLIEYHAGARKKGEPITDCRNWKRVRLVAQQFWGESLFLLQQIASDETSEFVLTKLSESDAIELLMPMSKLRPMLLKQVSHKWAEASSADAVRRAAAKFLYAYTQGILSTEKSDKKATTLEIVLRRIIHDLTAQFEKNPGKQSALEECVELIVSIMKLETSKSVSGDAGFRVATASIRQLASALSTALTEKTTSAGHMVFSLSFVRSVQLWVGIIGRFTEMKSLVFPLSSVILLAIRAKESHVIYLPYIAHLAGSANSLMASSGHFIPVAGSLLKALSVPAKRLNDAKSTTPAGSKNPNVETSGKLQESQIKDNKTVLTDLVKLITKRLAEHLELLAQTPAFKEVSFPVLVQLKRLVKLAHSSKFLLKPLIAAIEESAILSSQKRSALKTLPTMLFSLPECSAALKKFLAESLTASTENAATKKVDEMVKSGKLTVLKTAELKKAAEEDALMTKRQLKRRRQNDKKRAQFEEKQTKKQRREDDSELKPMVISDDEE